MPGNGWPTVPSRNASGVFAVTAPVVSVIPYTSRILMPRPAKNLPTSAGSGAAADSVVTALPRPSSDRIGPEHLSVGALEGLGHLGRHLAAELASLHVRPARVHGPRHGSPLRLVLLRGHQGGDSGLHLLPDPRHAEQRGRLHVLQRAEKILLIRAEVDVRGLADRQVDRQHPLRDVRERQVGDPTGVPSGERSGHMQATRLEPHTTVGVHHALGVTGGSRGVQQGHRVIGRYRGHPPATASGSAAYRSAPSLSNSAQVM